jgi:hypothetical protein
MQNVLFDGSKTPKVAVRGRCAGLQWGMPCLNAAATITEEGIYVCSSLCYESVRRGDKPGTSSPKNTRRATKVPAEVAPTSA